MSFCDGGRNVAVSPSLRSQKSTWRFKGAVKILKDWLKSIKQPLNFTLRLLLNVNLS